MTRRAIVLALALLSFGPGAGADTVTSGPGPRFPNPVPCTADECRLFLSAECTDQGWVQESSDDPRPTAGNFTSIIGIPSAARGGLGFMEWSSGSLGWLVIRTDCSLGGRQESSASPASYQLPADAGWLVVYRPSWQDAPDMLFKRPFWWRWREV